MSLSFPLPFLEGATGASRIAAVRTCTKRHRFGTENVPITPDRIDPVCSRIIVDRRESSLSAARFIGETGEEPSMNDREDEDQDKPLS